MAELRRELSGEAGVDDSISSVCVPAVKDSDGTDASPAKEVSDGDLMGEHSVVASDRGDANGKSVSIVCVEVSFGVDIMIFSTLGENILGDNGSGASKSSIWVPALRDSLLGDAVGFIMFSIASESGDAISGEGKIPESSVCVEVVRERTIGDNKIASPTGELVPDAKEDSVCPSVCVDIDRDLMDGLTDPSMFLLAGELPCESIGDKL